MELWLIHRKIDLPIKPVAYNHRKHSALHTHFYPQQILSFASYVLSEESNSIQIPIDWHYNYEEGFCYEWVFSWNFANPLSKYSISKNHLQVFKARSSIMRNPLSTYLLPLLIHSNNPWMGVDHEVQQILFSLYFLYYIVLFIYLLSQKEIIKVFIFFLVKSARHLILSSLKEHRSCQKFFGKYLNRMEMKEQLIVYFCSFRFITTGEKKTFPQVIRSQFTPE